MTNIRNKERIGWIDALRGFTMILVVFSHVEAWGLGITGDQISANAVFRMFRMPLFFFVSGFIAYKFDEDWNACYYKKCLLKKLRVQLIPMLFFGLLYTMLVYSPQNNTPLRDSVVLFFNSSAKLGYWFTEVLLEMFLVYYTVSFLMRRRRLVSRQIVLGIIAVCFFVLSMLGSSFYAEHAISNWLCLSNLFLYFQFFVFGVIVSCYREKVFRIVENPYIIGVVLLSFFGLYIAGYALHNSARSVLMIGVSKITNNLVRYLGVITLFALFRHYQKFFSSDTRVGRGLQYVGRRTLDIYLLHYFLIPTLPSVGSFLSQAGVVIEVTAALGISILVILFCLIISSIIRISPFLAYWLFGVKWERNFDATTPLSDYNK
jgi:fucose 4-O-acetylase-like acetyltransferase